MGQVQEIIQLRTKNGNISWDKKVGKGFSFCNEYSSSINFYFDYLSKTSFSILLLSLYSIGIPDHPAYFCFSDFEFIFHVARAGKEPGFVLKKLSR